jgi:hypothetical protein
MRSLIAIWDRAMMATSLSLFNVAPMKYFSPHSLARHVVKLLIVVALLTMTCPGCGGSGPHYHTISGTVTFQGSPVPMGEVSLTPNQAEGNTGPTVVCQIADGHYHSPPGKGVVGGAYIAVISGFQKPPASRDPTASEFGKRLFPIHRVSIELPNDDTTKVFELQ